MSTRLRMNVAMGEGEDEEIDDGIDDKASNSGVERRMEIY